MKIMRSSKVLMKEIKHVGFKIDSLRISRKELFDEYGRDRIPNETMFLNRFKRNRNKILIFLSIFEKEQVKKVYLKDLTVVLWADISVSIFIILDLIKYNYLKIDKIYLSNTEVLIEKLDLNYIKSNFDRLNFTYKINNNIFNAKNMKNN